MTDKTQRPVPAPPLGSPRDKTSLPGEGAPDRGARGAPRRRSGAGGRIAAAGIGIAAMLGLVANMEVADGRAQAAKPAPSSGQLSPRIPKDAHGAIKAGPGKVAAANVRRPIVLTPHAVVNTVSAPSSGGGYSGGSSGGYAAAPAPAAAPVVSTSGSH